MFVSDGRAVPVSFAVAASRLEELARGRLLDGVSKRVYDGGLEYLLRVGPAGAVPGVSRLVRVMSAEPARHDGAVSVALRWETTGAAGGLFPALDADIRLIPDGDNGSTVTLTGSYRPPFGMLGERLDRLVLHTVATATITELMTRIGSALEGAPAPAAEPDTPWHPVYAASDAARVITAPGHVPPLSWEGGQ